MELQKKTILNKWGEEACSLGWVSVPTLLLFAQKDLKISASELNVLMNLLMHWWDKSEKPYPSQSAIAFRSGLAPKTVQRALHSLEDKGLIGKTSTARSNNITRGRNYYDLTPLVERLNVISPVILTRLKLNKILGR